VLLSKEADRTLSHQPLNYVLDKICTDTAMKIAFKHENSKNDYTVVQWSYYILVFKCQSNLIFNI